jgi:glycosyltransferase involved in cell wall biosynthesis
MAVMSTSEPLVTVGMAVYNGEEFLSSAIASITSQRYRNWELLIVDDGSTDSSADIVQSQSDPRIHYVRNEVNRGLVGVRNQIMERAQGRFLSWLDQDDVAAPDRLSTQVSYLAAHGHISACGSWTRIITDTSAGTTNLTAIRLPTDQAQIRAQMPFRNPIACNTATMRLADFRDRGLVFRPEFGNSLDYDLWSQASDTLQLANIPMFLGSYRVHANQTSTGRALQIMQDHELRIQIDLLERALSLSITDEQRRVHALATRWPVSISQEDDLSSIADWFALLRSRNEQVRGFAGSALDRSLARQWLTVCNGARSAGMTFPAVIRALWKGPRRMGLPIARFPLTTIGAVARRR